VSRSVSEILVVLMVLACVAVTIQSLVPFALGLAFGAGILWFWRHLRDRQQLNRQSEVDHLAQIDTAFYQLIQQNQGRVTLLDFSLKARLPAETAKEYLERRAKEFNADFDVTQQGNILYCFETVKLLTKQDTDQNDFDDRLLDRSLLNLQPLNQTELADRLQVSPNTISRRKFAPDFPEWSRCKDPDGVTWDYSSADKRFHGS